MFVFVALVRVMVRANHSGHLTQEYMKSVPGFQKPDGYRLYQKLPVVKPSNLNFQYNR